MHATDPRAERIERGLALARGGRPQAARRLLTMVWRQLSPIDDAPLRVDCARTMACLQDDPHDRLCWCLRAVTAAEQVRQSYLAHCEVPLPLYGFYPTVLSDLAGAYRLVGDDDRAQACEQLCGAEVAGIHRLGAVGLREMSAFASGRIAGRLGVPLPVQDPWAR
ncbi:hypothetical protein [Frankia tisae]|uniref:hypothetical protein n=1 Tax=Frankia tisae TaxID=2950104 RepID=UPI0021C02EF5|nr:hypothetical protein [Frankia tisae]